MATRPDVLPRYAMEDQIDEVTGAPNVEPLTPAYELSGEVRGEGLFRQFENFIKRKFCEWIAYFDDAIFEGTATTVSNTIVVTIPDQGDNDYRVLLTPTSNVGSFWVDNKTATSFTINTSTSDGQFDWLVVNK